MSPPTTPSGLEKSPSFLIDSLGKLGRHRDIRQFLTAALQEVLQAINCQAGSLLLSDQPLKVREGDLCLGIEGQRLS